MQATATATGLPIATTTTKPLWAAVGVLGVAVAAMGASLIHIQNRPIDGQAALATAPSAIASTPTEASKVPLAESLRPREDLVAAPAPRTPNTAQPVARPAPRTAASPTPAPTTPTAQARPAPAAAPVQPVQPAVVATAPGTATANPTANPTVAPPSVAVSPGPVTANSTQPAPSANDTFAAAQQPLAQPVRPVCASCGTVESVTAFERKASPNGVGAVAGGVLGAVVGNQFGKGGGRTATTILGAIGGGVAGNMIEKNMRKETAYQVRVRMDDGSMRTVEQPTAPAVGTKVTVDGATLRSADGTWSSAPPSARVPAPAPSPRQQPDYRA